MFYTGEELRSARRAAGLTQSELAFAAGTSQAYIAALEKRADIPFKIRGRLVAALVPRLEVSRLNIAAAGRLTPEDRARNHARQRQESERLTSVRVRNKQRDLARPQIRALQTELAPLAARQDWDRYRVALARAAANAENDFVQEFIAAAQSRVLAADDPLALLPAEPLDPE